jgi:effector-binding domain-containing protein
MQVLVMADSASNTDRIGLKMGEILSVKLAAYMKKAKIKSVGPPMAWFRSQEPPFFFEAGFPIDKKPGKLDRGITIKQIQKDSVIIAHFYGPYELTYQAYEAVYDVLKARKRKPKGQPVEIYIDDPLDANGKPKDPYKVLTDIVFPF